MGRQFRVFILPLDANALVEQLGRRFGAKVFADYSTEYEVFEVDSPIRENPAVGIKPATRSVRCYLAPSSDQVKRSYYAKPNWWVIDTDSEGIEFSGCEFDGKTLLVGRFWYETNVVRNLQYVPKSSEFIKWAEAVCRYTKRLLHYEREIYAYIGEEAMKFRQQGGQFASMIRPDGTIIPA